LTKPLRVAFFVPDFPRLSETFVVQRFTGMLDRGLDVHIVCRRFDRGSLHAFPRLQRVADLGSRVHKLPHTVSRLRAALEFPFVIGACLLRRPVASLRYLARGRREGIRVIREMYRDAPLVLIGPDVVHFEFGVDSRFRIASCKRLAARVVVSFQGSDINYVGLEHDPGFYADVWQHTDIVHAASNDLWRRAVARGCPPERPHVVIVPVVNLETFSDEGSRPARDSGEPLRILSVGRLHWKKGHEHALVALRMLIDRGIAAKLRIVGDGPHEDAIRFTVSDLGLGDRVTFVGPLEPVQLREEFRSADIFVHPAVSEGFSLVVLEAQALGLPVVATDADGLRENLEPGVTGLVVRRRDPGAIADAVQRLADDPSLRESMGAAGRKRARTCFAPETVLASYEAMYRHVAGA
jgi:colanic acid/amylovoran biosynthesis glycosyltransferase